MGFERKEEVQIMTVQVLFCCLGIVPKVQLLKRNAWLLRLFGDEAPPGARGSSEVACVISQR